MWGVQEVEREVRGVTLRARSAQGHPRDYKENRTVMLWLAAHCMNASAV
jgi:hypothetical protein